MRDHANETGVDWIGGALPECGPAQTALPPRGTAHSFLVTSAKPCRHLAFFTAMGARELRIPEDMDDAMEAGIRYKMTFTGRPMSRS